MPAIETTGESPHDTLLVKAVMHWPASGDDTKRRQYYVAEFINGTAFEPGPPLMTLPVQTIQTLLFTPSWPDLVEQVKDRTRLGMQAGDVLLFMFLMDRLKDRLPRRGAAGASLDKAFAIASAWASKGNTWGDGVPIGKSKTNIKKAWAEFKSVSHLWAAFSMNTIAPYAPARQVFHPEYLPAFLETAAYLERFAKSYKLFSRETKRELPLVDADTAWALDTQRHRARMLFPDDLSVFDDAPFMSILKTYKAKQ